MRHSTLQVAIVCVAVFILTLSACAAYAVETPDDQRQQKRGKLLDEMRELAKATSVRFQGDEHQPQLLASPVFRYDDQPRRFIDATMWVWTDGGRPVAFEKIEARVLDRPLWGYCFTSLSEHLLDVTWGTDRAFRSTEPGIVLRPLAEAPAVATRSAERKLQVRKLSREFSARILINPANNNSEQMRLLSTPIYEYADPQSKLLRGAVFGFATNGTNPDLLVVLEASGTQSDLYWHYAAARMTTGGVTLKYRETAVAEIEFVPPRPVAFPTWTFFNTPRQETPDEIVQ